MVAYVPPKQAGKYKAVASGAITNGKPVVVHTDGTVKQVSQTVDEATQALGTNVVFETGTTNYISGIFDSTNNKVVFVYQDSSNSGYSTVVVCTIASNGSMSAGTPVVYASHGGGGHQAIAYLGSGKVALFYKDDSGNNGDVIIGTVSGTTVGSFGSAVEFTPKNVRDTVVAYDTSTSRLVMAYRDGGTDKGVVRVASISGTTPTFGSEAFFHNAATNAGLGITFDSNSNKIVIAYVDGADSSKGKAVVGTVSGTSISLGTEVEFEAGTTRHVGLAFDSTNNKVIVAYEDGGDSNKGKAKVGTVSGTSISFGSEAVFTASNSYFDTLGFPIAHDSNANKIVIVYPDESDGFDGEFVIGTVSGTSISFSSSTDFETDTVEHVALVFDSNVNKFAIAWRDGGNSNRGTVRSLQLAYSNTTNTLTSENYIGIASGGTYADTAEATIDVVGTVNKDQSGLTAGQTYYVQNDGTLGTSADDPSVVAGTAISATELIVKG